jgi:hypothetical protein
VRATVSSAANYFAMLGVPAAEGRTLSAADDRSDGDVPVVVSYLRDDGCSASHAPLWTSASRSTPTVPHRGAAARRFTTTSSPADVWAPMAAAGPIAGIRDPLSRNMWWLHAMARLAPGVSVAQAQGAVSGISSSIAQAYPDSHDQFGVRLAAARGAGPHDRGSHGARALLPAGPRIRLLSACANGGGRLRSRGLSRRLEIADMALAR